MNSKPRVINIGLKTFYDALTAQGAKALQLDWRPPAPCRATTCALPENLEQKVTEANRKSADAIINSQPYWVDILPAGECVDGLEDHMILHSGPPVEYEDMCTLHKRGMISGILFEGWAADGASAEKLLLSGKIKIESALDHNTVGAGTGIITKSVAMMVIEDKATGRRAATFPAEGPFQGGFCGWGLYSPEIAENLRYMREDLFPYLREFILKKGGLPLKPILAESMQMGDENHTRQNAADLLFIKQVVPELMKMDAPKDSMIKVMEYITETPRFFHCFGQGASRSALLSAAEVPYSSVVTAVCGNAIEFGIKISGLGDRWFMAPAPDLEGKYTSSKFSKKDQLPWIGDSCVVECAGLGGLAAAASPIVCRLRGLSSAGAIAQTREMEQICVAKNHNYPIPNLNFDFLPVGIDMFRVLETGITPEIHGGMFNHEGGLIGAGSARVPIECFEKAYEAFVKEYGDE